MATTKQHPSHEHPLELSTVITDLGCVLCHRKISLEAYTCQERCEADCYHRACVEAPPKIDRHPLHPVHTLNRTHHKQPYKCDACDELFYSGGVSFRCDECNFDLDVCCALSRLSDTGDSQGGKTPEEINLPIHHHPLTSFSTRHDFVWYNICDICRESVEGDGYMCLHRECGFTIHRTCIRDLYYADGTKAPRVYHYHPMEILIRGDTGTCTCSSCGSNKSGEFIGCAYCQVFYHRNCFQVPEILRYPSHNPDHTLVLFLDNATEGECQSCSSSFLAEIYYRCTSCEFFVHVRCAIQILAYCEEGMSAKIELSWHKHPLLLCHRTESFWYGCFYCGDGSTGPTYVCKDKDCEFRLHKRCTEIEATIAHPHHPDHPLILRERYDNDLLSFCKACDGAIDGLQFSCEHCLVALHVDCVSDFPSYKHYLHEHKLLHFNRYLASTCNRCGKTTDQSFYRCVPCNFNLHKECMELPQVVESKIHWHPLTLYDTFIEDDSGEYYCEHCEKTRDPRLGVYVCQQCKLFLPRIYHMHCVLPELAKVYAKDSAKESFLSVIEKLNEQIAGKREEVRAIKENLDEAMRKLDELVEQRIRLLEREEVDNPPPLQSITESDELVEQRIRLLMSEELDDAPPLQ